MFKKISKFFDKLEDRVRTFLSRRPVVYALIGGTAVVLFWRGVWMIADALSISALASIVISTVILLLTGLFVSFFIGDQVILSGIAKGKKITEKTEMEVTEEAHFLEKIHREIHEIKKSIEELKK